MWSRSTRIALRSAIKCTDRTVGAVVYGARESVHAIHVIVSTRHDWLEYAAAAGALLGGAAAVVALVFAALSKREAERSANAAEATQRLADEQVGIMRQEAAVAALERSRRAAPEMQLGYRAIGTSHDAPPAMIVFTVGFSNENGTRPVDRLTVNLRVPNYLELRTCDDEHGNGTGSSAFRELPSVEIGGHRGALVWFDTIGPIDRRVFVVRYLKIGSPPPGSHRIEVELAHPDIPDGQSRHAWMVTVPERGEQIEFEQVPMS